MASARRGKKRGSKIVALAACVAIVCCNSSTDATSATAVLGLSFHGRPAETGIHVLSRQGQLRLERGNNRLCYQMNVRGTKAAHVHDSRQRRDPAVVILFEPPSRYKPRGCVQVDEDIMASIIDAPSRFYVDLHHSRMGRPLKVRIVD